MDKERILEKLKGLGEDIERVKDLALLRKIQQDYIEAVNIFLSNVGYSEEKRNQILQQIKILGIFTKEKVKEVFEEVFLEKPEIKELEKRYRRDKKGLKKLAQRVIKKKNRLLETKYLTEDLLKFITVSIGIFVNRLQKGGWTKTKIKEALYRLLGRYLSEKQNLLQAEKVAGKPEQTMLRKIQQERRRKTLASMRGEVKKESP